jgi:hypothetical protein
VPGEWRGRGGGVLSDESSWFLVPSSWLGVIEGWEEKWVQVVQSWNGERKSKVQGQKSKVKEKGAVDGAD